MTPPIVSVLMTVYNREPFLRAAIESVRAQWLTDWELIIVDDRSTDQSLAIAHECAAQDRRIRVSQNKTNLGDYANRNRAASLARGKYLKYVDADDLIYPHCLSTMVAALECFPDAAWGLCYNGPGRPLPALLSPLEAYRDHFLRQQGLFNAGPLATIIRATAFDAIGHFSTARYVSDGNCWLRLAARWPLVILAPGLYWWRKHDSQESRIERASPARIANVAAQRFRSLQIQLEADTCPLPETERHAVLREIRAAYGNHILRAGAKGQIAAAFTGMQASGQGWRALWNTLLPKVPVDVPPVQFTPSQKPAEMTIPASHGTETVSFLVLDEGNDSALQQTLETLRHQPGADCELIVVGDQPRELGPDCQYTAASPSDSQWEKWNKGANAASGRWLKLLSPGCLAAPACARIGASLLASSGSILGAVVSGTTSPAGRVWLPEAAWRQDLRDHPIFFSGPEPMWYDRQAFLAAGGFCNAASLPCRHLHLRLASQGSTVGIPGGLLVYPDTAEKPRRIATKRQDDPETWLLEMLLESPLPATEQELVRQSLEAGTQCDVADRNGPYAQPLPDCWPF